MALTVVRKIRQCCHIVPSEFTSKPPPSKSETNPTFHMSRRQEQPINWGRKFQGAAAGFACGSVIGMFASTLHSGRIRPNPQSLSAALFMGTVLGIGGAIKIN